jgi:hypothetical protein
MIEETDAPFELNYACDVTFTNLNLKYEHPEVWKTDIAQQNATGVERR